MPVPKHNNFKVILRIIAWLFSEKTVTAIKPGGVKQVVFELRTPSATGVYGLQVVSELPGDADLTNDNSLRLVLMYITWVCKILDGLKGKPALSKCKCGQEQQLIQKAQHLTIPLTLPA